MPYMLIQNMFIFLYHALPNSQKKPWLLSLQKVLKISSIKINFVPRLLHGNSQLQPFQYQSQILIEYVNTYLINQNIIVKKVLQMSMKYLLNFIKKHYHLLGNILQNKVIRWKQFNGGFLLRFKTLSCSFWGVIKMKVRFCEPIITNIPAFQNIN
jgi:hypothetical protein